MEDSLFYYRIAQMLLIAPVNKMLATEFSILIFEDVAHSHRIFVAYTEAQKEKERLGGSCSFLGFHRY